MSDKEKSLAVRYPKLSLLINLLLVIDVALFGVGIFSPLITLDKMFFWHNTVSVVTGIFQLLTEGHYILFLILFGFSLILPLLKLILLGLVWNGPGLTKGITGKAFEWLGQCTKWAMLDVFVVAIIVVSVKLKDVAEVSIHYGVYLFMASIFITLFLTSKIEKQANMHRKVID